VPSLAAFVENFCASSAHLTSEAGEVDRAAMTEPSVYCGSNLKLAELVDAAFDQAGRWPDAVLTAHVHNYQRFTRVNNGREIPYIVSGAGGGKLAVDYVSIPKPGDGGPPHVTDSWQLDTKTHKITAPV
jgi:hypothetical protein